MRLEEMVNGTDIIRLKIRYQLLSRLISVRLQDEKEK